MALKPCPECGREISTQADACPNCGWRMPHAEDRAPKQTVVAKEGCFLQTLNCGCVVTLGFIILCIIILVIANSS